MVQHASVRAGVEIGIGVVGDAGTPRPEVRLVAGGVSRRVTTRWLAEAELSDLVDESLAGEPRAIEQLLARIQPLVLRYCRARVGSRERTLVSAEDIAQEVCLAVVSALGKYKYEPGSFLAFVYGIAAHKVADARRRAVRSRSEVVPELPDTPALEDGPEQRAMNGEMIEAVTQLLRRLPERQREILVLRVAVGLSAEETAAAVGSTPGAVRVAQHRALARMREMFAAVEG
ncbi:RNA polymerase sigma-70 factor (ECF subfamily) [Saccharothrix tamanrassetensis]|uniref:RNA polymerase sigma-70 factor (ECF subfamily) n=1 Tax=Saccharothrix tamanrassetensis TaxID=1051531 RepID=A0A841CKY6_9PSEU|nr:RNA polymerase sigma factor ShbA [Saccharothrix tamanrassetensis]MBB5956767.1 RNA polymerase sigma-70 factor (ECF subfamily) [Saccharothrix tamanrassetensis]